MGRLRRVYAAAFKSQVVWAADMRYVPMAYGLTSLVAIIDWYSRCVLGWRLSNSRESSLCVVLLEEWFTGRHWCRRQLR